MWHLDDIVALPIIEDGVDEPSAEKRQEGCRVLDLFDGWVRFVYDGFVEARGTIDFGGFTLYGYGIVMVLNNANEGWQPVWRVVVFDG